MAYEERGVGALPILYGAPAYHRPPRSPASPVARPFDPDDLPIEALRADDAETAVVADEPPVSSSWADMVAVLTGSGTDNQYHAATATATAPGAVQVLEPIPEPEPTAPAPTYPAEPIAAAEPKVLDRLGGLFKGRGRGAS